MKIALGNAMRVRFLVVCLSQVIQSQLLWASPMERVRSLEPTFMEVTEAVFKAENMEWKEADIWREKMKGAPWFPTLYVGFDHSLKETASLSIGDNISVSGSGVTIGPNENDFDQVVNNGNNIHFKAIWSLENLIFHKDTFQARREMSDLMKSRLTLREQLYKVFSERRKLQVKFYNSSGSGSPQLWEEIAMLTQKLDDYTHGVFAERWTGKKIR